MVLTSAGIMPHRAMRLYTKLTSELSGTDIRNYAKSALKLRCVADCRVSFICKGLKKSLPSDRGKIKMHPQARPDVIFLTTSDGIFTEKSRLQFIAFRVACNLYSYLNNPRCQQQRLQGSTYINQSTIIFSRILLTLRNIGSQDSVTVLTWGETVDSGRPIIQESDSHSFSHQRLRCDATSRLRTSDYLGPNKTIVKIYFHR
jgi:hypothetical protein